MSSFKSLKMGVVILLAVLVIAYAAWYWRDRYGTTLASAADGSSIMFSCATGQKVRVVSAVYSPAAGGKSVDVTAPCQSALNALPGQDYVVNSKALLGTPSNVPGTLTLRYKCVSVAPKSHFTAVPVSTCGIPYEEEYAVDMDGRSGTVVGYPYSTQSRVSLERYAESPEVVLEYNPIIGTGKGAAVRAMNDRYRGGDALDRLSAYELRPNEPGYMVEVGDVGDGAASLMAKVARRSPTVAAGAPSCLLAGADIDSDFLTDGFYDQAVLKEALTSRRHASPNTLTADRVGLGSTRLDPRFEPGPQTRIGNGDASPAPGSFAGGTTFGALGSTEFRTSAGWDWGYVHGFPDAFHYYEPEALVTEDSRYVN